MALIYDLAGYLKIYKGSKLCNAQSGMRICQLYK